MQVELTFGVLLLCCGLSYQQSLLESLIKFLQEGAQQQSDEPKDTNMFLWEYDFIVVGAGTAGCVVANRLTENPNWNVLLLEAGESENYIMDLPILANYLQFTSANWNYRTQPSEKFCLAMENKQCRWPRGKVVGGSSVLNYMIYTRGNWRDYDHWENLGNEGWSYKDILPYYRKIENFTIDVDTQQYHGTDGYLSVSYAPYRTKLSEAIVKATEESGMQYIDINGPKQIGVSYLHVSMKDGVRHSSSRAYLHPIKDRPNFYFRKQAMVKKILINPQTKQAYGVEVVINGRIMVIKARREVILSAGAINSPQLLMLSGVGPKQHLTKMNISVIKHLKVGYNLMDHIAAGGLTFEIDKPYSVRTNEAVESGSLVDFLSHHKGPLSLPGGCEVITFSDLKDPKNPDGYPDIELLFQAGSIVSDPSFQKNFGITDEIYRAVFEPIEGKHSFMVMPMLLRPKSKGRIILESNDYLKQPLLFPNYFAHKDDMDTIVQGIKLAINVSREPGLQAIGARLNDAPIPGCKHLRFGSDEYWRCHARHFTFTIYHLSGTCKMGPKKDKSAVVDPRLRVYGIKGLRVIDASIIPEVPAAHTNAPVFMIAEKGTDMIKEDWKIL
ncbi:hypothetical protein FQA39_LY16370 [Lamprigera yunnana]|nr:hypothetical protein FQA39_LY16370 [Lamprigera yunnana]